MYHETIRLLCATALALATSGAGAAVLQTFGAGTAVGVTTNAAHFELNMAPRAGRRSRGWGRSSHDLPRLGRRADGADFYRIEFAAGSGYQALNGYWATYADGQRTGSGNFSSPRGAILGLADGAGFDEVRYFAFSTANRQTGYSAPALDEVRIGLPEPASPALCAAALAGMAAVLRRRKRKYA